MAIGARSFMSSRAVMRKRVTSPIPATSTRTHALPGNQQLLPEVRRSALDRAHRPSLPIVTKKRTTQRDTRTFREAF